MPIRAPRYAAVLLAAAAIAVTAATAAIASTGSTVHVSHVKAAKGCQPHTKGIGRNASAAQIVRTMRASIPDACGFTVTGELLGADFGIDGVTLVGPTTFDGRGQAHVVYASQGVVLDFYRVGGADYVRLYEYNAPTAVPDLNLRVLWSEFGVSSRVVNKAGSTKWVRLTPAQQRAFNRSDMLGKLGTPSSLATALADGTAATWKLSGTKVIGGIKCAAITDPAKNEQDFTETIYVNEKTGLPVTVRYAVRHGSTLTTGFGHWSSTSAVTRPAKVVAG
ncbi:MAG: hypothetical protein JO345_04005 [Streptosporangiaceae bacterium]|nr:hypothetical protein [Streptosporangiaceae bacterium]